MQTNNEASTKPPQAGKLKSSASKTGSSHMFVDMGGWKKARGETVIQLCDSLLYRFSPFVPRINIIHMKTIFICNAQVIKHYTDQCIYQ